MGSGGVREGFEDYFVAEGFELADRAAARAFDLSLLELLRSWILVGLVDGEQLPAAGEDLVGDRDDRFLSPRRRASCR